ncbi:transposase IS200 like family protein [Yersinia pestis 1045]|nr:transposase IS200 like family protein [Yersinia pestis 1045]
MWITIAPFVTYSFCAEVPKAGVLQGKTQSDWQYFKKTVRMENVNILEAEYCVDHIHMLLEIPPKMSVSGFMGYLKGKSSLMLYEQFGDLKFKYRNREFWCRGYYVDTVGKNTARIQEYIKHQLEEDKMGEQLSIPYPGSPFTGRK